MMNYEVLFVIDPTLEEDKKNAAIDRVKEVIASEGEVGDVDIWGLRKLAYPIQKKNEGYYVVIQFKAEATLPAELDRRLKISDDYMRHMIVCKDEKQIAAAKAAAEARAAYVASQPEEVEAPEEVEEAFDAVQEADQEPEAVQEADQEAEAVEQVIEDEVETVDAE